MYHKVKMNDGALYTTLEKMKLDAITHMYLQSGTAYFKHLVNDLITIPNIIIGGVMSVSIMTAHDPRWVIAQGVLAVSSTILSALSRHMKAGEESLLHAAVVKQYNELVLDIEKIMLTETISTEIVNEMHTQLKKIYTSQPDPSMVVVSMFNKKFISVPYVLHPELESIAKSRAQDSISVLHKYIANRQRCPKMKPFPRESNNDNDMPNHIQLTISDN